MTEIWLEYGLDQHGNLVHIAGTPERGTTSLRCPYCQGDLIARKGHQVIWHFAHEGKTCAPTLRCNDGPSLPLYHDLTLGLTPSQFVTLQTISTVGYPDYNGRRNLIALTSKGLAIWNPYRGKGGGYGLTKLGKILFGELSLNLFCQVQVPLIEKRMEELRLKAKTGDPVAQVDLRIFRAQVKRIRVSTLYFLEIQGEHMQEKGDIVIPLTIYKVGVTTRTVEERVMEIVADLRQHFTDKSVQVLGAWPGRGNVESYFKFKYKKWNYPLGSLTEYFAFDDVKPVMRDLRRMPD